MIIAKKSLGQNFLIDKNIVNKIINSIDITQKNIIEIGPGLGALTEKIIEKKPKKLIIIEKDYELYKLLLNKFNKKTSKKHFPSEGEASLCGVIVEANPDNGLANNVSQFINGGELKNTI